MLAKIGGTARAEAECEVAERPDRQVEVQKEGGRTAFVTDYGQWEFLRVGFGLVNAPAVFQKTMNQVLKGCALVYMDDILIATETIEEGFKQLEIVLKALPANNLTLNLSKCKFFQSRIDYLGREISSEGVRPGKRKIDAILKVADPINVKQVRQFLGLAGYFRKFIKDFARKVAPLTNLLRKNVAWSWGEKESEVVKDIKAILVNRPILTIYDPNRETEVHTDACAIGLGAILIQKEGNEKRVIAYYSRKTTSEEQKYHSYDLETLAVFVALTNFRVYLLGIKFTVVTDCSAVRATANKKDIQPRVARWWVYLQDYNFEIAYRPGAQAAHVDFLSRNPIECCKGHFALERTLDKVREHYWFKGLRKYVSKYVNACLNCLYYKSATGRKPGFLHPIEKIAIPFHTLHHDHVGPFVRSTRRNTQILTIVDGFTKFCILEPVHDTSVKQVLKALYQLIAIFGVPTRIISDRGTAFTSHTFRAFCVEFGIKHVLNAVTTPRANGQCERMNRTVLSSLAATCAGGAEDSWDENVKKVQSVINCSINRTTRMSPTQLLFGYKPRSLADANLLAATQNTLDQVDLQDMRSAAKASTDEEQDRQKKRFDVRRFKPPSYRVGHVVMVDAHPVATSESKKLAAKAKGPLKVTAVLPNDRYEVQDLRDLKKSPNQRSTVAVDSLKRWVTFDAIQ
ncbi:uncharacterized protein LOC117180569 [Belonocnema kinseyi]|uniref:uncharacterized protein LOC117180569 n=1 Tax=Belonocnema kinseyi TaxID=2817044 RepID=UPI00143DDC85|nr:uncharacterized protein LOC117180569 [Belonocnema kinseyi]